MFTFFNISDKMCRKDKESLLKNFKFKTSTLKGVTLMSTHLTPEERERRILENMRLVYHFVKRLPHVSPSDFDDLVQIGRIGLIKAASTFDDSKGTKFSTYAARCINNEINMYFRKERPHRSDISLNDTIYVDNNGSELEIGQILSDGSDFVDEIVDEDDFTKAINIILNVLSPKEAIVILYEISGIYTQGEVGKGIGVSQSYVARLRRRAANNVRSHLENGTKPYCPAISMVKVGSLYQFSCNRVNECLIEFLKNAKDKNLIDCKFIGDNERIDLLMLPYPGTFDFIAELMKKIYGY